MALTDASIKSLKATGARYRKADGGGLQRYITQMQAQIDNLMGNASGHITGPMRVML